ncbi:MAG: hypothetical protein ABFS16_12655 [Bacteroidota bacterium]
MESWSAQLNTKIDNKLETVKEKDLRFYRIDEFKRNISRGDLFSTTCPTCKKEQINITEVVEKIDEAVNVPGESRREYDRLIGRISKHMQKEHGFYAPYYFTYMYSFIGIVAGVVLGLLLIKLNQQMKVEMFSIGFAIGLLPSYVLGYLKDQKIRSAKKLM